MKNLRIFLTGGCAYAPNAPSVGTSLLSRLASLSRVLKSVSRLTMI